LIRNRQKRRVVNIYRIEIEWNKSIIMLLFRRNNFITPNPNIKEFAGIGNKISYSSTCPASILLGILDQISLCPGSKTIKRNLFSIEVNK